VLGDVWKLRAYELARWRNGRGAAPVIPESTLTRAPSAELRPAQRDVDSLPPYEVPDPSLARYVERAWGPEEFRAAGCALEPARRIAAMVDRNEYKRRQAAPVIRVSGRAFGIEWDLPPTTKRRGLERGRRPTRPPPTGSARRPPWRGAARAPRPGPERSAPELHLRRLRRGRRRRERIFPLRPDHPSRDALGGLTGIGVVHPDRLVVVAPGDRDPVLRLRQLVLERDEVLVRAQLRVRLDRDVHEEAKVLAQRRVRTAQLLRIGALAQRLRQLLPRLRHAGPSPGDLGERFPFERGRLVHRRDQVRGPIVPAAELGLDVRPHLLRLLVQRLDPVVAAPRQQRQECQQRQPPPSRDHESLVSEYVSTKAAVDSASA